MQKFLLILVDIFSLYTTFYSVSVLRILFGGDYSLAKYFLPITYSVFLITFIFTSAGVYSNIFTPRHIILKKKFLSIALSAGIFFSTLFIIKQSGEYSRIVFVTSFMLSIFSVYIGRHYIAGKMKILLNREHLIIIGSEKNIDRYKAILKEKLGTQDKYFKTYVCQTFCEDKISSWVLENNISSTSNVFYVNKDNSSRQFITWAEKLFKNIYISSDIESLTLNTSIGQLDDKFFLRFEFKINCKIRIFSKKFFDLLLILISLPFTILACLAISIAIAYERNGSILFKQKRIGKDGNSFYIYKFRTMHENADNILADFLRNNHKARIFWEENHKLKDDPRVTRIGKFLRKTSLDELPQLINVIKGEMSLVGPRPIVEDEIRLYGDYFDFYKRTLPGLTGLWQVSGRSNTPYDMRVELDAIYVRNWSMWMDIYILARTVNVVIRGAGAC